MSVTLDLYQISVTNRIVATGDIYSSLGGGVPTAAAPFIDAAIAANGNQLDPAVLASGNVAVQTFANGIDTRTRGFDLSGQYGVDYAYGHVNYVLTGTYTDTALTNSPNSLAPPQFVGQPLYDARAISDLTTTNPKFVFGAGADWTYNNLTVNLLEKLYGPSSEYANDQGLGPNGANIYYKSSIGTIAITNLDLGYKHDQVLEGRHWRNQPVRSVSTAAQQHDARAVPGCQLLHCRADPADLVTVRHRRWLLLRQGHVQLLILVSFLARAAASAAARFLWRAGLSVRVSVGASALPANASSGAM